MIDFLKILTGLLTFALIKWKLGMCATLNHSVSIFCSVVAAVVVGFSISMIVVFSFSLPVGRGERCRGHSQTS